MTDEHGHKWPRPRKDPPAEPAEPWAGRDKPDFDWDQWRKEHGRGTDAQDDPES